MPDPVELRPGRQRRLWHAAGGLAAATGIGFSGIHPAGQVLAFGLLAVLLWHRIQRAPRPVRVRVDADGWRVLFSHGVERAARPGTTLSPWPGVVTLRCGWRRLVIFADECSTADFRRLRRWIRAG